jgi:hypothetical protein
VVDSDELIARAAHAQRLLEDPMMVEAFASVVKEAMNDWANTRPEAVETREGLWRMVQSVHRVQNVLKNHIISGKNAAERAERPISRV